MRHSIACKAVGFFFFFFFFYSLPDVSMEVVGCSCPLEVLDLECNDATFSFGDMLSSAL